MSRRLLPFIAIAALGCADAPPLALPLAVEFSGCAAVGAGPTCAVSADAELVLWAPDAGLWTLRLMVDGEAREMGLDPTPGGLRHRLKVAPGQQLTIEADGPLVRARWSMSIVAAGEALTSMAEDSAARATRLLREGARARDLGHLQDALAAAEEVAQISARLDGEGLGDLPLQGQVLRAQVDARLGRYEDALGALIRTLAEPRLSDCLRAEANRTLGRTRTLARAADPRSPAGEPLEPLRAARSAFGERGECPDEGAFVGTLLEEAHAAAQSGKVAEARRALDAAEVVTPKRTGDLAAWVLDVQGRVALAAGLNDAAEAIYADLARQSAGAGWQWRAKMGLGEAAALGQRDRVAAARFAEAEAQAAEGVLDRLTAPGQDAFAADRAGRAARAP